MGCDHLQWLNKVGYIKIGDLTKIDEYHSKGWFFGLAAGLIISAYKLKQAVDENKLARAQLTQSLSDPTKVAAANKQLQAGDESDTRHAHTHKQTSGETTNTSACTKTIACLPAFSRISLLPRCVRCVGCPSFRKRNKQLMAILKNACDIVIPSARLGWLPVSDGTVGIAGTITSVIGIRDTWPASK